MNLRITGKGERFCLGFCSTNATRIRWEAQDGTVRVPQPETTLFMLPHPFEAAGKTYTSTGQLTAEKTEDGGLLDAYGRRVMALAERFPCFDSYDFEHENRYYRWSLIIDSDRLTMVYTQDEDSRVWVVEDVLDLPDHFIPALEHIGLISPAE